ncbi:hypothetical protein HDU80_007445 [Chytriomyces hyalinus]|nr:hypothetical protein HDU80_007445 [Chytriomyces hyalinus]
MSERQLSRLTKKELVALADARGLCISASLKKEAFVAALAQAETESLSEVTSRAEMLEGMSKVDLVRMAKEKGLKTTGKKSDLVKSIIEDEQTARSGVWPLENQPTESSDVALAAEAADLVQKLNLHSSDKVSYEQVSEARQQLFCSIHRQVFDSDGLMPGRVALRTGIIVICDLITKKEHQLKIAIDEANGGLPSTDFQDNVVCRSCIDRNRAMHLFHFRKHDTNPISTVHPSLAPKTVENMFKFDFSSTAANVDATPKPSTLTVSDHKSILSRPNPPEEEQFYSPEPSAPSSDCENDEFALDEHSYISNAADNMLALLDEFDALEKKTTLAKPVPATATASAATVKKNLRSTSPPPTSKASPLHPKPVNKLLQSPQILRRQSIQKPLLVNLAHRRLSAKVRDQAVLAQQAARTKKIAASRQQIQVSLNDSLCDDDEESDDDTNANESETNVSTSNGSETSGSVGSKQRLPSTQRMQRRDSLGSNTSFSSTGSRSQSLKLPASREERKARGEVLWKAPVQRQPTVQGDPAIKYVPVEDKKIAQTVEAILGMTAPGSEEEWKLITGSGKRGLQRSP